MQAPVAIWLEMHAQTLHNAAGVASGHFDVELTPHGREQAQTTLKSRYAEQRFDAVYASDTRRAVDTARLMFADRSIPIHQDARLRECDYGVYEGRPRAAMEAARSAAIRIPFPGGESFAQVATRMRSFLDDIAARHEGQSVMLIGHAATLFTLRHLLEGLSLEQTVGVWTERPWRFLLR